MNLVTDKNYCLFKIDENIYCARFLDKKIDRFELEFNLEQGTCFNTFLLVDKNELIIIHPPEENYTDLLLNIISEVLKTAEVKSFNIVTGHINPRIIECLKVIVKKFQNVTITCSNPGLKLIKDLWGQKKPNEDKVLEIDMPIINLVKKETTLFPDKIDLRLIPAPTARWPGGLIVYSQAQQILFSEKIFSAHIATENWSEKNRLSTENDRKYFYDCLMAPMSSQITNLTEKIAELDIKTIAPIHGPAIEYSLQSLLNDYVRWGGKLLTNNPKVVLIYASAYGNTASIGDALAKGINRTSIEVESINCEFASNQNLSDSIKRADGYLIGSPTLGGHAPTPIVSALGTLLSEGDKNKPIGIFGSFGWSGEAIDLLESKLKDGGFTFSFEPIRIKFSPSKPKIKELEEIGTHFGRKLLTKLKKKSRTTDAGMISSRTNPTLQALGRVVGSLCVLTAAKGKEKNRITGAMLASWVSQASFSPPGISIAVAKDRAVESLLQKGDQFALNILSEKNFKDSLKTFTKPFAPGEDRFSNIETDLTPNNQIIISDSLAWLDASVKDRMECGDHWIIYAEVNYGNVLRKGDLTAVHHRKSGSSY